MNISDLSDIQSEGGVIGTLIYHPEFIMHTEYLKPGYFYGQENGCIYWAIQELYKAGIDNIDAYNISNMLKSNKAVERCIEKYNLPSVQEFVDLYKTAARHSLEEYKMLAQTVTTYAFKRDTIKFLNEIESLCYDSQQDLGKLNDATYKGLTKLTEKYITSNEIKKFGESADELWEEICNRRTESGIYGIPSKYPHINEYCTYEPGELIVVQAKYKEGKSVFLLNEAVHKLKNGVPTLVVDSEMSHRLYMERLIAHLSKVELKRIKNGRYNEEESQRIKDAIQWIKEQPFVHIYDPEMTNDKLYSICKILKYKIGLQFVVYDYLKSNEPDASTNYNMLGAKTDFLKNNIAGQLNLSVLAACQLNKQGEVADSMKINRYLSVGIKWFHKTQEQISKDGLKCGNYAAKISVNRLGEQMPDDDDEAYIDFFFDGSIMSIVEAEQQHMPENAFG